MNFMKLNQLLTTDPELYAEYKEWQRLEALSNPTDSDSTRLQFFRFSMPTLLRFWQAVYCMEQGLYPGSGSAS